MTTPWKTVPVEPTPEMIEAGRDVKRRRLLRAVEDTKAGKEPNVMGMSMAIEEEWAAMLAAAPQQGPMTEKRINKLRQEYLRRPGHPEDVAAFVRAIEQFHGIKQQASDEGGGG